MEEPIVFPDSSFRGLNYQAVMKLVPIVNPLVSTGSEKCLSIKSSFPLADIRNICSLSGNSFTYLMLKKTLFYMGKGNVESYRITSYPSTWSITSAFVIIGFTSLDSAAQLAK